MDIRAGGSSDRPALEGLGDVLCDRRGSRVGHLLGREQVQPRHGQHRQEAEDGQATEGAGSRDGAGPPPSPVPNSDLACMLASCAADAAPPMHSSAARRRSATRRRRRPRPRARRRSSSPPGRRAPRGAPPASPGRRRRARRSGVRGTSPPTLSNPAARVARCSTSPLRSRKARSSAMRQSFIQNSRARSLA